MKLKYPGKQRSHEWPVTPGLQWHWPPSCSHVVPFSVPVLLQEQAAEEEHSYLRDDDKKVDTYKALSPPMVSQNLFIPGSV